MASAGATYDSYGDTETAICCRKEPTISDIWSRRLRALPWAPRVRYPHLAPGDAVELDVRRHPIMLGNPAFRTVVAVLALALDGANPLLLVLFALSVAGWANHRLHAGLRKTLIIAGVPTVALLLVPGGSATVLAMIALVLWLVEDVADWYHDRLVVTRKRIYRMYGVFTTHTPSVSLAAVAYIDASQPLLGRLFAYGTVLLDSAAQRDEPLSRFDHMPQADYVHVKILELRAAAMPKYPTISF